MVSSGGSVKDGDGLVVADAAGNQAEANERANKDASAGAIDLRHRHRASQPRLSAR